MTHQILSTILGPLEAPLAERARLAVGLMQMQTRGAELFRHEVERILKPDQSPVTVADLLHQAQLQQELEANFPDDGLICEEEGETQQENLEAAREASARLYGYELHAIHERPERGEITWVQDPIDGTKGYLAGRSYAIALGFFAGETPAFAAMSVPGTMKPPQLSIHGALAIAIPGHGAWMTHDLESDDPEFTRLGIGGDAPSPMRVSMSLEHGGGIAEALGDLPMEKVRLDSQAKFLAVAAGEMDLYVRLKRNDGVPDLIWDYLPGALIATEAGCSLNDFTGVPLAFRPELAVGMRGGMICHRGTPGSPLAETADKVAASLI